MRAKIFLLSLLVLFLTMNNVSANVLNNTDFDMKSKTIEISGKVNPDQKNTLFTLALIKGDYNELNLKEQFSDLNYLNLLSVQNDGSFHQKLMLPGESGVYSVFVKMGELIEGEKFYIYSQKELNDFIYAIRTNKLTDIQILEGIKKYSNQLTLNSIDLSLNRNRDIILRVIKTTINENLSGDFDYLNLIDLCKLINKEIHLLDNIKNSQSWYEVYNYLNESAEFIGINFDDYEKINSKNLVCSYFINKTIKDKDELKQEFNDLVKEYLKASTIKNHEGGSGGSGGSGRTVFPTSDQKPKEDDKEIIFDDIDTVSWAKEAICALFEKGILSGSEDNTFQPNNFIKREEFAKIVCLSFNFLNEDARVNFADCSKNDWHYKYVASLSNEEIIKGINENEFGIGKYLTRQELATLLYRVLVKQGVVFENKKTDFRDFEEISEYAKEAISYLAYEGIINGLDDGFFAPNAYTTRAQAAKLIYGILQWGN